MSLLNIEIQDRFPTVLLLQHFEFVSEDNGHETVQHVCNDQKPEFTPILALGTPEEHTAQPREA